MYISHKPCAYLWNVKDHDPYEMNMRVVCKVSAGTGMITLLYHNPELQSIRNMTIIKNLFNMNM